MLEGLYIEDAVNVGRGEVDFSGFAVAGGVDAEGVGSLSLVSLLLLLVVLGVVLLVLVLRDGGMDVDEPGERYSRICIWVSISLTASFKYPSRMRRGCCTYLSAYSFVIRCF